MLSILLLVLFIFSILFSFVFSVDNGRLHKKSSLISLTLFVIIFLVILKDVEVFEKKEYSYRPIPVLEYYGNVCVLNHDKMVLPEFEIPKGTKVLYSKTKYSDWWRIPYCCDETIVLNKGD